MREGMCTGGDQYVLMIIITVDQAPLQASLMVIQPRTLRAWHLVNV